MNMVSNVDITAESIVYMRLEESLGLPLRAIQQLQRLVKLCKTPYEALHPSSFVHSDNTDSPRLGVLSEVLYVHGSHDSGCKDGLPCT